MDGEKTLRSGAHIGRIVRALFHPARGYYRTYPRRREDRCFEGGAIGSINPNRTDHWYSSSDIGCAFIAFDGVAQAYTVLGDPLLANLLDEMSEEFLQLDFRGIACQDTRDPLRSSRPAAVSRDHRQGPNCCTRPCGYGTSTWTRGSRPTTPTVNWFGPPAVDRALCRGGLDHVGCCLLALDGRSAPPRSRARRLPQRPGPRPDLQWRFHLPHVPPVPAATISSPTSRSSKHGGAATCAPAKDSAASLNIVACATTPRSFSPSTATEPIV